ncbi:MAG: hypothetical protein Q9M11_02380 [Mariprofundaceae bacterium]|nr:hypothetical protein [Mariprofundaceae bacterium]
MDIFTSFPLNILILSWPCFVSFKAKVLLAFSYAHDAVIRSYLGYEHRYAAMQRKVILHIVGEA